MFIVFEGIDGSGKTTLSNRLAKRLSRLGYRVVHARAGGELQSAVARRVREVTRDAALLEMSSRAELFLNLARDAQQVEEIVKPALARGEICIADRYLYSQRALSGFGRGLPDDALSPALDAAAQGIWPDLVVLIDVEPELARWRKRLGKILDGRERQAESRKGLCGAGLAYRVREGYLAMARADPARWLVLENTHVPLWQLEQHVLEVVLARLEGREVPRWPAYAPRRPPVATAATAEAAFFDALDDLEAREPQLSALMLMGVAGLRAHQRRLSFAEQHPRLVARTLSGLFDEQSWALRRLLAARAPKEIALTLTGDASAKAMALRRELWPEARAEVLASLKDLADDEAWAMRDAGIEAGALDEVLPSLAGLDVERAWELREQGLTWKLWLETARSLSGVGGERADAMREQIAHRAPLAALRSATGLDSSHLQSLRERYFPLAAKVVLRSLTGVRSAYAYEMRERAAPLTKEALDSVDGLDDEAAWSLRERYASRWPATALSSLEHLADTERGRALIDAVLLACPGRIAVLRNAWAVLSRSHATPAMRPGLREAGMAPADGRI